MKILILGPSGSGKSTLGRKLGEKHNLNIIHIDKIFWNKDWSMTDKEVFVKKLKAAIDLDNWVMDGNYGSWFYTERCDKADRIIFINYNRFKALYRIIKRRIMYNKKVRIDLPEGCIEKLDFEFIKYVIWIYPKKQRKYIKFLKENYKDKLTIINTQKEYDSFKI